MVPLLPCGKNTACALGGLCLKFEIASRANSVAREARSAANIAWFLTSGSSHHAQFYDLIPASALDYAEKVRSQVLSLRQSS